MSIRTVVVDDSNFMRKAVARLISSDPDIQVVGLMSSGEEAVRAIPELQPHVITLDVEMGGMDGLATLRKIMEVCPTPIVMFSAYTSKGAEVTLKALQEGAVDFIAKPSGTLSMDLELVKNDLVKKIKTASRSKPRGGVFQARTNSKVEKGHHLAKRQRSVVAIGSSTGGVQALQSVIPQLPESFSTPVMIVQHMPPIFTRSMAESLNASSPLQVKEAEEGEKVTGGKVYIAPGGLHMTLRRVGADVLIHLDKEPVKELLRPSVDVLFRSVAEVYGGDSLGVILTGMGNDGTAGAKVMKGKGADIIVQDEATSSVYGMPRMAVEAGAADLILPIDEMKDWIQKLCV